MKTTRFLFILSAVLFGPLAISAEDNFFGYEYWTEQWVPDDPGASAVITRKYEIRGSKEIDGISYKCVKVDGKDAGLWIRDEKNKVYLLREDFPQEILLYDFNWEGRESFSRQYIQDGELHEETISLASIGEMTIGNVDIWEKRDYIEAYGTKLIKGIGLISERGRDCCLLGSSLSGSNPSDSGEWRLTSFIQRSGTIDFYYRNVDAIHDLYSRNYYSNGGLTSGVEIYFYSPWPYVPSGVRLELDSIVGHTICLSSHYDSTNGAKYATNKRVCLGKLDAGDYTIRMMPVDAAEQKAGGTGTTPETVEIPFTVAGNPVDVPCGFVPSNCGKEVDKKEWNIVEGEYVPEIQIALEGDSLHVTGWLGFTPAAEHYCYYEIHGDSVYIETAIYSGTGAVSNGMWPFSVDFKIGPFQGSHCIVRTNERDLRQEHTMTFSFTHVGSISKEETPASSLHDLQGRPVDGTQKGIFIRNGKKVLIK